MKKRIPIEYDIGFADSNIVSYRSKNENVVITLKCWNEKVLELEFVESILVLITNSWNISDICEITESILLDKVLSQAYEIIPKNHEYRIFQFIDNSDNPAIEVISKQLIISMSSM